MTRDELITKILSRHAKDKTWETYDLAEPFGITHKGLVEKIRKLKLNKDDRNKK